LTTKIILIGFVNSHKDYIPPELVRTHFKYGDGDIPTSFDARTAWPQCSAVTGRIRDQSNCGSCWAFGSTEAFNDRYCLKTGDPSIIMSPEDTMACCTGFVCSFSMGCNGGQPSGAWNWFVKSGVCTGGDYSDVGTGTTCKPYTLPSCAHHVTPPPGMVACDSIPEETTPACTSVCSEKTYDVSYSKDKYHATSSYSIKANDIQKELMERGSISVSMEVYEDFESYTSGVYQHLTGSYLGGHSIKLIGWGVDNDIPYWICVNSWNDSWGESGTFRILRGQDECGIESGAIAGEV
jgi:cathepsin B